jgi:hypothetical protein
MAVLGMDQFNSSFVELFLLKYPYTPLKLNLILEIVVTFVLKPLE